MKVLILMGSPRLTGNTAELCNACKSEEAKAYDLVVVGHSHQNFVKENVVSVSASGLEGSSYLLIVDNEDGITFEHVNLVY